MCLHEEETIEQIEKICGLVRRVGKLQLLYKFALSVCICPPNLILPILIGGQRCLLYVETPGLKHLPTLPTFLIVKNICNILFTINQFLNGSFFYI